MKWVLLIVGVCGLGGIALGVGLALGTMRAQVKQEPREPTTVAGWKPILMGKTPQEVVKIMGKPRFTSGADEYDDIEKILKETGREQKASRYSRWTYYDKLEWPEGRMPGCLQVAFKAGKVAFVD